MRRRLTALAILVTLALAAIPFANVSGHGTAAPAAQNTGTTTPTTTPVPTTVAVAPTTVAPGDAITVIASNLPISGSLSSADQFCAYLVSSSGIILPLSRTATVTGTTMPPDPSLTPGGVAGSGVGSFLVPGSAAAGTYTVQIAACSAGTTPTSLTVIASSGTITVGTTHAVAIVTVAGTVGIGAPFTAMLSNINSNSCAFIAPVDTVNSSVTVITPGVALTTGQASVSLTIPSNYPSGTYQVFITSAASDGGCPLAQLAGSSVLGSTPFMATTSTISSLVITSSTGAVTTGSTVSITITAASGVSAQPVCVALWVAGQYTGIDFTVPASSFAAGQWAIPSYTIPTGLQGTLTLTATLGTCPPAPTATAAATETPTTTPTATSTPTAGPAPTSFNAHATIVIGAAVAVTPTVTATPSGPPPPPAYTPTLTATPTSTPTAVPTATPCPSTTTSSEAVTVTTVTPGTPAPTATPCPTATVAPTPTPVVHHFTFKIKYIRFAHARVREGHNQTIFVQVTPKTGYGIWVHVIFATKKRLDWYQDTNRHGYWKKTFRVPFGSITAKSHNAKVTVRIWHGKKHHDKTTHFVVNP